MIPCKIICMYRINLQVQLCMLCMFSYGRFQRNRLQLPVQQRTSKISVALQKREQFVPIYSFTVIEGVRIKVPTRRGKNEKLARKLKRNLFFTCNCCDTDKTTISIYNIYYCTSTSGFDFFLTTVSPGTEMYTHTSKRRGK